MQELVMKCEVCLELLDEYLDGELAERESSEVAAHLVRCQFCSTESAALVTEQEMFSKYDRELEVSASLWERIAEQTAGPVVAPVVRESLTDRVINLFRVPAFRFSLAAVALIVIALLVGAVYLQTGKSTTSTADNNSKPSPITPREAVAPKQEEQKSTTPPYVADATPKKRIKKYSVNKQLVIEQSDLVSSDLGYQDLDDRDTAKHLEQTENLLRSIRNVQFNDNDQEIDMSYDKVQARRLLNENIVLRRDAEMRAKFPAKTLLSDLEPFLIDIANLPDHAKPEEVRTIRDRVRKTEIVAALIGYDD
jgi:Putative zinc-finger